MPEKVIDKVPGYRWWTFGGGRASEYETSYVWLKLGPVTILCGRFLFIDPRFALEVHALNRLIWCSY